MAQVDFYKMLSGLGDTIAKQRNDATRKEALAGAIGPDGTVDFQKAILGFSKIGDMESAARVAQMADRTEAQKFRQSQATQAQSNADRSYELQAQTAARAGGGVYGTPIYGVKNGKTVLGAIGKDGQFHEIDTRGIEPTPGGIKPLDTGAGFAPFDPRRGGVVGPTVPKTGEVSKDYAPVIGGDGAVSARPIPGTPAAQKIAETEAKRAESAATTVVGSNAIKDIIKDVRGKVTTSPWYNPAVGFGAGTASNIPATNATDTAELVKTITANIGFDRLQRMRDESPTGGALGQVAVQELESLQKTIASLSQGQSKGQFLQNLKRVEDQYERINRKAAAYPNAARYGFGPKAQSQGGTGDLMLQQAKDAIAQGAPRDAVLRRLQEAGIDASGL